MPHRGGHVRTYYESVSERLSLVYHDYLSEGSSWNAARVESELMDVAQQISRDIDLGVLKLYR
jgi:hypothetical protein